MHSYQNHEIYKSYNLNDSSSTPSHSDLQSIYLQQVVFLILNLLKFQICGRTGATSHSAASNNLSKLSLNFPRYYLFFFRRILTTIVNGESPLGKSGSLHVHTSRLCASLNGYELNSILLLNYVLVIKFNVTLHRFIHIYIS